MIIGYTHEHIHMNWVVNLNDPNEQFAFIMNNEKLWAMCKDPMSKVQTIVIQDSFQILISKLKLECSKKLLTQYWTCLNVHNLDVFWILEFQTTFFFKFCFVGPYV
jgi:hypothetical protein